MIAAGPRGGEIHYLAAGAGAPLLLVHGAGGNAAVWWQQVVAFAARHRVIALDLPGFGRTTVAPTESVGAPAADILAAVLDAEGVARASLVCQSLGGWSGLRFALANPSRVERLVLTCTMAGVAHPPALAAFASARARMDERGPASLGLRDEFRADRPAMGYLYDQISAFNPPLDPALGALAFSPASLVTPEALAALRCPTLLLAGEHDPIWPPAAIQGIADAMPDARMEVIPGAGHSPYFEQPDAFNARLAAFLGDAARPTR